MAGFVKAMCAEYFMYRPFLTIVALNPLIQKAMFKFFIVH